MNSRDRREANQAHPVKIADVAVSKTHGRRRHGREQRRTSTVLLNIRRQSGTTRVEGRQTAVSTLKATVKTLPPGLQAADRPATAPSSSKPRSTTSRSTSSSARCSRPRGHVCSCEPRRRYLGDRDPTSLSPRSRSSGHGLHAQHDDHAGPHALGRIVIDDAIVVLENIYRFIEEKEEDQHQAAIDGTKEIGLARAGDHAVARRDLRSGGFMGGIVGMFMKSFG